MSQRKQKIRRTADPAEIADRLHSAAIHLLRRVRKQDTSSGEGPARLSALSVLVFGGPMTLGQLASAEQVKPPTMSRIVAGLEKKGLVEVVIDAGDARRIRIHATPKGTQLLQEGRARRVAALKSRLESLPTADLEMLRRAAELIDQLARSWDDRPPRNDRQIGP